MTAIHPHQLRPYPELRRRAAAALKALGPDPVHSCLVGVDAIVAFLQPVLGLTVQRELVYAWRQAGMPVTLLRQRPAESGAPFSWVTTDLIALRWLAVNGSIPGGRLYRFPARYPRNSRHAGPKQSIIAQTNPRRKINQTRGAKATPRKRKQEPVHGA